MIRRRESRDGGMEGWKRREERGGSHHSALQATPAAAACGHRDGIGIAFSGSKRRSGLVWSGVARVEWKKRKKEEEEEVGGGTRGERRKTKEPRGVVEWMGERGK